MQTADTPSPATDPAAADGFGRRVRSAVAWRWGSQLLAQAITWTSTIMVVRLLDPSDYGLFAMSQVVITALAFLNGYGFATSLIQTEDLSERRIGQVFGLLLLFNGALAAMQLMLAPVAAEYFREPLVADMLRIQALIFLTVPFTALPEQLLARRLEFKAPGKINMLTAIVGAITALVLAWRGFGVWALVYAPILAFATRAIGLTLAARMLVKPVFDFRGAGDLIGFGGALTLCQMFWIVQSQSDIFIAGRAFSTHELGLYSEALFLTLIVTGRFLPPINEVAYPAYSELHKQGRSLAPYFLRTLRTVLLVTAPIYVGLALTAPEAVVTLFGPKWAGMAPIAAGLAIVMPLMALQIVCSPATNAMGLPKIYLATTAAGAVIMPLAFLAGVAGGPMGLVHAWWVAAPLLLAATLALTLRAVGLGLVKLLGELAPVLFACAVMALCVVACESLIESAAAPVMLAAKAATGAIAYGATLWLIWPCLLRETLAMVRQRKPSA